MKDAKVLNVPTQDNGEKTVLVISDIENVDVFQLVILEQVLNQRVTARHVLVVRAVYTSQLVHVLDITLMVCVVTAVQVLEVDAIF